jgi:hypothetical protein
MLRDIADTLGAMPMRHSDAPSLCGRPAGWVGAPFVLGRADARQPAPPLRRPTMPTRDHARAGIAFAKFCPVRVPGCYLLRVFPR